MEGLDFSNPFVGIISAFFGLIFFVYIYFSIYSRLFQKVGPNEALLISGQGGTKILTAGGRLVLPFIHKVERFSLEIMTIEVITPEVPTVNKVPIIIDAVAQVKVRNDEQSIRTAAERFLSKGPHEMMEIVKQTVEGHARAIVGRSTVQHLIESRDEFSKEVTQVAMADLANMGITIDSFSIKDIKDKQGYIEAMGLPEIAKVKAEAMAAQAQRDNEARQARARADSEAKQIEAGMHQQAEFARIAAETKIAEQDKEKNLKLADYKKETDLKKAEADEIYKIQQYKMLQLAKEEEIRVQIVQKEREAEVQEKEIIRREKELEATVIKPAEAQRNQIETLANAEQYKLKATAIGQAEAAKTTGFAKAEVTKATALAEADATRATGLAAAEAEKAKGLAEADIRKAKGLAEADVRKAAGLAEGEADKATGLGEASAISAKGLAEAEAMAKKAEAWKAYSEAALVQLYLEKLPEMARAIAEPLARTEKIIMISNDGNSGGASKLTKDITSVLAEIPAVLESLTGMKVEDLVKKVRQTDSSPNAGRQLKT